MTGLPDSSCRWREAMGNVSLGDRVIRFGGEMTYTVDEAGMENGHVPSNLVLMLFMKLPDSFGERLFWSLLLQ